MENKEQKIKALTWKYFWQQKIREFAITFLSIFGIIFTIITSYIIGKAWLGESHELCGATMTIVETCDVLSYISVPVLSLVISGFLLWGIGYVIYSFFKWNWDTAKEKAERELD